MQEKNLLFYIYVISFFFTGYPVTRLTKARSLQYKTIVSLIHSKDPALANFLQPYSDNVNKTMNDIVGIADIRP